MPNNAEKLNEIEKITKKFETGTITEANLVRHLRALVRKAYWMGRRHAEPASTHELTCFDECNQIFGFKP